MAEISSDGWTDFSWSQRLARFATDLRLQDLPAAVVYRVKHFFVDYLGIALRASSLDSSKPVRALAARDSHNFGEFANFVFSSIKSDTALPADAASAKLLADKIRDISTEKPTEVSGREVSSGCLRKGLPVFP